MTRLYRLLHFGHTRLMVCVTTLSSALPALLLQHRVLSLRDFIVVSYPLHLYNTTFHPICKVFYYINSGVLGYYAFAPIAYCAGIALVMLVYRSAICYHISMGVKTKQREVRIEYMRLDEIQRDAENPKLHDLGALAESFERFDFVSPLGVNEKTGKLLWGHGRLDGLIAFMDEGKPVLDGIKVDDDGMWKVPIVRGVHFNSKKGTAYVITDNRQVELGGVDEPKLAEILIKIAGKDGRGLRGTGYDGDDVDTLIRLYRPDLIEMPEDPGPQIDKAEASQEKWQVNLGDIWEVSGHFIICGDCREAETWEVLLSMAGIDKVSGVFTSPPYAEQRKKQYGGVPVKKYVEWWEAVQANVKANLVDDGSFFVNIKPHCKESERVLYVFDLVLAMKRRWDWRFVDEFCWLNSGIPGGWQNRFKNGFEPVYHFSLHDVKFRPLNVSAEAYLGTEHQGYAMSGSGVKGGGFSSPAIRPDNVIRVANRGEAGHPAKFVVALPDFFIRAYSDPGDVWIDPFVGSGTTIVAAHQNERRGLAIELLEKYVAVTLERMSGMGLEPRLMTP